LSRWLPRARRLVTTYSRRYKLLMAMAAFTAIATISVIGYRTWAYSGWMEYKLTCYDTHANLKEIVLTPEPELQDAIETYYNEFTKLWSKTDQIFRREGDRFLMRPWYYINMLDIRSKDTGHIVRDVLGADYERTSCSSLEENPTLFVLSPDNCASWDHIYSQEFAWLLSFLAPTPPSD
jgi:hypothetical protein